MARMHGERVEEYHARRRWAVEAAVATAAKQKEYELMRRNGIPLPVVEITPACTCSLRLWPHVHSPEEARRFRMRMPPGREERA